VSVARRQGLTGGQCRVRAFGWNDGAVCLLDWSVRSSVGWLDQEMFV